MADNVTANPGSGGATFASDDVGGVQYPRVKPAIGADGSAADVSSTNPMPVRLNTGSANQTLAELDLDSGGGTVNRVAVGIALPGAGGPVAGGTVTNPIRVDPTNFTYQGILGSAFEGGVFLGTVDMLVVGGRAVTGANLVTKDPYTSGEGVLVALDPVGRVVVSGNAVSQVANGSSIGPKSGELTTNTEAELVAAPAASYALYVTELCASNGHATQKSTISFKDGTTTRVQMHVGPVGANFAHMKFDPPWKLTTATNLKAQCSDAANVFWTVHFFTAKA